MYRTFSVTTIPTKSPEKIKSSVNQEDFEAAESFLKIVAGLLLLVSQSTASTEASQNVKTLIRTYVEGVASGVPCNELEEKAKKIEKTKKTKVQEELWEKIKLEAPVSCFKSTFEGTVNDGVNYIDYSSVVDYSPDKLEYPTDQTVGGVVADQTVGGVVTDPTAPNYVEKDDNWWFKNWEATRFTRSIEKQELESVKTMLKSGKGININIQDNYGKTAFDYMLKHMSEPIGTKNCYEMLQHDEIFSVEQLVEILHRAHWKDWRILDTIMGTNRVPEDKMNSIMDENNVKGFVNSIDDTNMILKPLLEKLIKVHPRNKNVMYRESIKYHRKGIFEKLMDIEPYEPNEETGDTLLHLATGAMNNSDNANAIVKDLLINQPNTIYEENTRGLTPLMVAVINSNSDAINLFKNHYSQTVIDVMNLEVKRTELYRRTLRLYKYINESALPRTKIFHKKTIRNLVVKLKNNKEQQKRIREQWESSSKQLPTEQLTREQSVMTTDFGYIGVPRDVRKELDGLGNLGLKRR